MHSGFPSPTILCCRTSLRLRLLLMADSDNEQNKSNLVVNQHYDETVEVNDDEEVASTFTPSPRPGGSRPNAPGRLSMSMTDHSDDEFDHDNLVEKKGPVGYGQSGGGGGTGSGGGDSSQLNPERTKPGLQGMGNDDDDDDDDEGDDQSDTSDDDDDDDDNHGPAVEGAYDPADYEHLPVSQEIKELFQYITRYTPQTIDLEHKLKPFIPDFIPAVGDIDAFIKVTRPDGKPETLGLLVLDEPTARQSDPTVLDLQLRTISKQTNLKAMTVRSIDDVEKNPKAIDTWIESIRELHRQKPAPTVHYQRNMPDIEELMQEWPSEFEDLLNTVGLPSAELDVDLAQYVDLICGILDIPVHKNRIHSLHVLFTLFSEFKNSQHFHQLAKDNQLSNDLKKPATEMNEMNEMTGAAEQLNLNDSQALTFE